MIFRWSIKNAQDWSMRPFCAAETRIHCEEIADIKINIPASIANTPQHYAYKNTYYKFTANTYDKDGCKVPKYRHKPANIIWELNPSFPGQIDQVTGEFKVANPSGGGYEGHVYASICNDKNISGDRLGDMVMVTASPKKSP